MAQVKLRTQTTLPIQPPHLAPAGHPTYSSTLLAGPSLHKCTAGSPGVVPGPQGLFSGAHSWVLKVPELLTKTPQF